ncbi:hypothetical protein UJ101_01658 [Flavobacteriaceae bacterium UJ101]|nr:hypothetical protein UJ101_01658 [Flavobacteriaceae bacterium UJ101]
MNTTIKHWQWNFAAGFIPFTAGFIMLITSLISKNNPNSEWNLILGKLDFSFHDISNLSHNSGDFLELLSSLSSVNIIIGAFSIIMISYFALKHKQKWAWWFMFIALIWLGFQDAYSVFIFYTKTGISLFIMPFTFCTLMTIGLILTRKQIFDSTN